jgi:N-acetylneuraminic acid mutarotase
VTFNATTGVLSGTPAAGTAGTYAITFTAANGITPNATQSFTLTVLALPPGARTNEWRWMGGSSTVPSFCVNSGHCGQDGSYGVMGVYAVGNLPGSRVGALSWSDTSGNLWLFGGTGYDSSGEWGELNDLWEYNISLAQWRWIGGTNALTMHDLGGNYYAAGVYGTLGLYAAGNVPSGRDSAMSWVDSNGNFWLFGGEGYDSTGTSGDLNDLWEFSPTLGQWRWVSGSSILGTATEAGIYGTEGTYAAANVPAARLSAVSWSDPGGDLWLFGGTGYDSSGNWGDLNDLWEYNPTLGQWRWMSGSNTLPACAGTDGCGATGVYGTEGAYAVSNVPGGRAGAAGWSDASGNLWLFGGQGYDSNGSWGNLSDLWEYNLASGQWQWASGNNIVDQSGVYGSEGTYATGNLPGGSASTIAWSDASGNFWLFRGFGDDSAGTAGYLNDLWEYSPAIGEWRWMSGSSTLTLQDPNGFYYVPGVFGTLGSYAAGNVPGSRQQGVSWTDVNGNLWLFGGYGYGSGDTLGWLNDFWEFSPAPSSVAPTITSDNSAIFVAGVAGSFTVMATGTPAPALSESGAMPGGVTFSSSGGGLTGILPGGVTFNTSTGVLSGKPAAGTEGSYAITFTATNGFGVAATQSFTLTVLGPAQISSLSPSTAVAGGGAFTLTVNGSNFVSGAKVLWNGTALTTSFVSAAQLTATVPASLIAGAGTAQVCVQESSSNSPPALFTTIPDVIGELPVLLSITPGSASTGSAGITLTVNGANFNSSSIVLWNGSPRATTFVNGSQLQANVLTQDLAAEGMAMVTVANKSPAGVSSALPFIVQSSASVATIRSVTVANTAATGGAYPVTVIGKDFVATSILYWGSAAAIENSYWGDGWLSSLLPSATRPATLTVVNPSGTSASFEMR